ncbi:putative rta1 domain [Phaeomoniella chlamydospora]|uniref:Putative rta1 domain n=1 Tax=Phaeomoniella chlamydospora TaxID=158046 RepID=A0A0G2HJ86_PHACM|nr:putative rta1 domain [Phaeomoniella chlamydospora]
MASEDTDWSLYPYNPVKPLPIVFAVFLTFLASVQIYQCLYVYRWRRFYLTMTIASASWLGGFICRAVSVYLVRNVNMFVAQYVLLFVGPPFYAGAEYFVLGRILAYVPYYAPLHPGRVLSTFLLLEMVVEAVGANGAAGAATAHNKKERNGAYVRLEIALILQSLLELCFFSLVILVEKRCRRGKHFTRDLRTICYVLYITSAMMLIRCVFRAVQCFEATKCAFDDPQCAIVDQHEWFFWVFEVANITLYVSLLAIFPPGKYLPPNDKVYLDLYDGKTERIGPGFAQADKRSLWVTVVDPFDLAGTFSKKGRALDRFWEGDHPVYRSAEGTLEPRS